MTSIPPSGLWYSHLSQTSHTPLEPPRLAVGQTIHFLAKPSGVILFTYTSPNPTTSKEFAFSVSPNIPYPLTFPDYWATCPDSLLPELFQIEWILSGFNSSFPLKDLFPCLTSNLPQRLWLSGQIHQGSKFS